MPWNDKTPHQPVPWPHGRKSKGPRTERKKRALINKPPRQTVA